MPSEPKTSVEGANLNDEDFASQSNRRPSPEPLDVRAVEGSHEWG